MSSSSFLFQDQVKQGNFKFGERIVLSIRVDPQLQQQEQNDVQEGKNIATTKTKQVRYIPSYNKPEPQLVEVEGVLLSDSSSSSSSSPSSWWIQCDLEQQQHQHILFMTPKCVRSRSNYEYLEKVTTKMQFVESPVQYNNNNNNNNNNSGHQQHFYDSFRIIDVSRGGISVTLMKKTDKSRSQMNGNDDNNKTSSFTQSWLFSAFLKHKKIYIFIWFLCCTLLFLLYSYNNIAFGNHPSNMLTVGLHNPTTKKSDSDQQQQQQQQVETPAPPTLAPPKTAPPTPAPVLTTSEVQQQQQQEPPPKPVSSSSSSTNSHNNDNDINNNNNNYKVGFPYPPYQIPQLAKEEEKDPNKPGFSLSAPPVEKCEHVKKGQESPSNCPDEDLYLTLWHLIRDYSKSRYSNRPLTLVDVGSNKGYTGASMLETLNLTTIKEYYYTQEDLDDESYENMKGGPNRVNTSSTSTPFRPYAPYFSRQALAFDIFDYAEGLNTPTPGWRHALFGACCDGDEASPYDEKASRIAGHPWMKNRTSDVYIPEVEVFMFDGTKAHVDYVEQFYTKQLKKYNRQYELLEKESPDYILKNKNIKKKTNIKMHFTRAAVSNETGETRFCADALGLEFGNICPSAGHGIVTPIISLDTWEGMKHVDIIDMLVTDTEGHDFPVAVNNQGVRERWLKKGKIGIYIFEIQPGVRDKTPLDKVVEDLESWGYTCYYPVHGSNLKRHVVKVSPVRGGCWADWYTKETRGWANMVCHHGKNFPELQYVFDELSILPKDHTFKWCDINRVNQVFFSKNPGRNWTWATEQMRILAKIEADKKTTKMPTTTTSVTPTP